MEKNGKILFVNYTLMKLRGRKKIVVLTFLAKLQVIAHITSPCSELVILHLKAISILEYNEENLKQ